MERKSEFVPWVAPWAGWGGRSGLTFYADDGSPAVEIEEQSNGDFLITLDWPAPDGAPWGATLPTDGLTCADIKCIAEQVLGAGRLG